VFTGLVIITRGTDGTTVTPAASGPTAAPDGYEVRPFEPGDAADFLELYRTVFDSGRSEAWLDWKYRSNPYVDDVPILIAERGGVLVGARPLFALRMRVGDGTAVALQPADAMVHPDHRRRGLFTRLTAAAIDRYRTGAPAFLFNFPNSASLTGYLDQGWDVVDELRTYYRIHDPAALAGAAGRPLRAATPLLRAAARGYVHARGWGLGRADEEVTVTRHETVPAATLADRYQHRAPAGLHAVRDAEFYRWRFGEAPAEYTTYLAERAGEPAFGVVVTDERHAGAAVTRIVDVAPPAIGTDDDPGRAAVVAALRAATRDARDAAAIVAPASPLPREPMAALGFHERDTPVLSRVTGATPHVARSIDGDPPSQTVRGVDLLDPGNWTISFAEHDNC